MSYSKKHAREPSSSASGNDNGIVRSVERGDEQKPPRKRPARPNNDRRGEKMTEQATQTTAMKGIEGLALEKGDSEDGTFSPHKMLQLPNILIILRRRRTHLATQSRRLHTLGTLPNHRQSKATNNLSHHRSHNSHHPPNCTYLCHPTHHPHRPSNHQTRQDPDLHRLQRPHRSLQSTHRNHQNKRLAGHRHPRRSNPNLQLHQVVG